MPEHPPPDPAKLAGYLEEWERGDVTPGMAMSNLKKGGLPALFDSLSLDDAVLEVWGKWEKGGAAPGDVLAMLREGRIRDRLAAG